MVGNWVKLAFLCAHVTRRPVLLPGAPDDEWELVEAVYVARLCCSLLFDAHSRGHPAVSVSRALASSGAITGAGGQPSSASDRLYQHRSEERRVAEACGGAGTEG